VYSILGKDRPSSILLLIGADSVAKFIVSDWGEKSTLA
jgi:hypothetical protein